MAKNPFSNTNNKKNAEDNSVFQMVARRAYQNSVESRRNNSPASTAPYQSVVETPAAEQTYRDATFKDITWNALKQGYYNSRLGEESYDAMMGNENEQQKYLDILAGEDYQFEGGNAFEDAIAGAAQLLGQQARQWTNTRTLGAAATGAATGAGIGAVCDRLRKKEDGQL